MVIRLVLVSDHMPLPEFRDVLRTLINRDRREKQVALDLVRGVALSAFSTDEAGWQPDASNWSREISLSLDRSGQRSNGVT
jgi:hypothetical protein